KVAATECPCCLLVGPHGGGPAATVGRSVQQAAAQRVGQGFIDVNIDKLADQSGVVATEVDDTVVLGAALQLARVFLGIVADQDALDAANHAPAVLESLLIEARLENRQALLFDLLRGVVGQLGRRR